MHVSRLFAPLPPAPPPQVPRTELSHARMHVYAFLPAPPPSPAACVAAHTHMPLANATSARGRVVKQSRKGFTYKLLTRHAQAKENARAAKCKSLDVLLSYSPKRAMRTTTTAITPLPRSADSGQFLRVLNKQVFPSHWQPLNGQLTSTCLRPGTTMQGLLDAGLPSRLAAAVYMPCSRKTSLWRTPISEPWDPHPLAGSIRALLAAVAPMLLPPTADRHVAWEEVLSPYPVPPPPRIWQPQTANPTGAGTAASACEQAAAPQPQPEPEPEPELRFNHKVFERPPIIDPAQLSAMGRDTSESRDNSCCLRLDQRMMAQGHEHMAQLPEGYLRLQLTTNKPGVDGGILSELAHRIITWFIHGPPHAALGPNPVVMHTCNHPDCLNPSHLMWGTHSQNRPA